MGALALVLAHGRVGERVGAWVRGGMSRRVRVSGFTRGGTSGRGWQGWVHRHASTCLCARKVG